MQFTSDCYHALYLKLLHASLFFPSFLWVCDGNNKIQSLTRLSQVHSTNSKDSLPRDRASGRGLEQATTMAKNWSYDRLLTPHVFGHDQDITE